MSVVVNNKPNSACNACQKRKVKCIGNPCVNCLKKDEVCEFSSAKKRGPKKIKLNEFKDDLQLQECMNIASQQQYFIDFYFQYIWRGIPIEFKDIMQTNNIEYKPQVYVITASIMKMHGNTELELTYINKANKASNLFNCDTFDSAITLMMMAGYFGHDHPKTKSYILIAQSILQLPTIENTVITDKARAICQIIAVVNGELPRHQKSAYLFQLLSADFIKFLAHTSHYDFITISTVLINNLLFKLARFEAAKIDQFLASIKIDNPMDENGRKEIISEIEKLEKQIKIPIDVLFAKISRFIVEWRSGYVEAALLEADATFEFCKDHTSRQEIWLCHPMPRLLLIPYYYKKHNKENKCTEYLNFFQEIIKKNQRRVDEMWTTWDAMNGTKSGYNIAQLEEELLGAGPLVPLPSSCRGKSKQ